MAEKAKIIIKFEREALEGENISIYRRSLGSSTFFSSRMLSVFKPVRTRNNELPIIPPTSLIPGEAAAIAFMTYFDVDFNPAGLMTAVRGGNFVTITIEEGWEFTNESSTCGATFENYPFVPDTFKITSVLILPSTDPCTRARIRIMTSEIGDSYIVSRVGGSPSPDVGVPITSTQTFVEVDRALPLTITLYKAGQSPLSVEGFLNQTHLYIPRTSEALFNIRVVASLFDGATVTVNPGIALFESPRPPITGARYEYSLNGVNWQSSNIFTGQVDGSYTMWIKDWLGCIITKDFVISGIKNARPKYFYVSDLNSVGFNESEKWNDNQNGISKNPENTLGKLNRGEEVYDETLIFREDDKVTIQFKSNFDNNIVTVEECKSLAILSPIVNKKTNNLDLYEVLDAKMYSYGDGSLTAIYYDEGVVYDRFRVPTGEYELNGNLPDSAIVGNVISISMGSGPGFGGAFEIMDIIYDETIGKNVMLFNFPTTHVIPIDVVTFTRYDVLNYDVYEFELDFSRFTDNSNIDPNTSFNLRDLFRVKIRATDSLYKQRNFYSDWIDVIREDEFFDGNKYYTIDYFNENNRSIFYLYGIKHFIRAEVESAETFIDDTSDLVKGDTGTYLTESIVNNGLTIKFADVTHKVLMKLVLAISSEHLFINGLGYAKSGSVEIEPVENTNLYSLICNVIRNSENFNTFANGETGDSEGYDTIYIPQLITTNLGGSLKV